MDYFAEQLVKKYPSSEETLKKTLAIVACVVLSLVAVFFAFTVLPYIVLLVFLFVWLAIYYIQNMYVEYEYAVTNGTLDIDKIVAKKKRTSLLSVDVKNFTKFEKYGNQSLDDDNDLTRYHVSDGTINHLYFADFSDDEHGNCRIYFSPSSEVLESIQPFVKNDLKDTIKKFIDENKKKTD